MFIALVVVVALAASHHTQSPTVAQSVSPSATARPKKTKRHVHRKTHRSAKRAHVVAPPTVATSGLSLIAEPDAGLAPIYALLGSARHSLDLEIYELEDDQACAILAADARRGVQVHVLLDARYVEADNEAAYTYLRTHGVAVRWAPARFDLTHEKAIVVDDRTAAIMTMNLTARYYSSTRDFVVLDRRRSDVAAIAGTFAGDWAGSEAQPDSADDLLWSPGAQDALVALIGSARHELLVENEEMSDRAVIGALEAAAQRGVRVEVVMTRESDSQNFSVASLLYDRELGLITSRPAIVAGIAAIITGDGAGASPWSS
jgi:phosphatidylserine/phosphatidylglycerophosphate/cardiolipin synthase-like enzyme